MERMLHDRTQLGLVLLSSADLIALQAFRQRAYGAALARDVRLRAMPFTRFSVPM